MTETASRFGTTGALALVVSGIVWSVAVVLAESGSSPDVITQGTGILALLALLVGMGALLKMVFDVYDDVEL